MNVKFNVSDLIQIFIFGHIHISYTYLTQVRLPTNMVEANGDP